MMPFIVTLIVYIFVVYLIGYFAARRTKNLSDYVIAGRSLSGPIAALGAGASDMSSWLFMALPAAFLLHGANQIFLPLGLVMGAYLNWQFIAKRLRIYSEIANDALTIPAYFDNRFLDTTRILRIITAIVILIFFTAYASAGFISGAVVTQIMFGLDYQTALYTSAAIIIIYTCIGGFLAVNWIDFFQGSLMFVALLVVPVVTFSVLQGWDPIVAKATQVQPDFLNMFHDLKAISVMSLLVWGLGYFGQPHILVRFMAAKSEKVIPMAKNICMSWMILAMIGASITGMLGMVFFQTQPLERPEQVFIKLSQVLFNPWIAAFLMAAVLSAIMSTIAAQLLASSSSIVEDFYHAFFRKKASDKEYLWVGRLCVLLVAVVAVMMASNPSDTIMQVVEYAWSGLGASFGPVMLLSLYWSRMTRNSAVLGMIAGAIMVIVWHVLAKHYGGIFGITAILPGFLVNTGVIIATSLLAKERDPKVQSMFQVFQNRVQAAR